VEVSFTKISDDVLVPSHQFELKDGMSLRMFKWFWWGLGIAWIIFLLFFLQDGIKGIVFVTLFFSVIGISFSIVMKLPYGWIELNRKEGTVTVWTSAKKRKRVAKGNFTDFRVDWANRYVQTSRYSAERRYSLGLYPLHEKKKYSKTLVDGKQEVPFCFLYDMAKNDTKRIPPASDAEFVEKLTLKTAAFLNDFFAGKPLPEIKNNVYQITI
jgi:hypothetical protein